MKKQVKHAALVAKEMWKRPVIRWILVVSIFMLAVAFFIPFWKLYPEIATKPAAPLHYNIHFGVDLFGAWWRVFTPAMLGAVIFIANVILALVYWRRQIMLSLITLFAIPALMAFLILASLFITLLNLSYD